MPLVKARCTSCDGELQVDPGKDAAICPYCGTPYIVEKAINNYNKTVNNNFNGANINVNVSGIMDADTMFENWLAALTTNTNTNTASKLYQAFLFNYATDGRCEYMRLWYNIYGNTMEQYAEMERLAKRYMSSPRYQKYINNHINRIREARNHAAEVAVKNASNKSSQKSNNKNWGNLCGYGEVDAIQSPDRYFIEEHAGTFFKIILLIGIFIALIYYEIIPLL